MSETENVYGEPQKDFFNDLAMGWEKRAEATGKGAWGALATPTAAAGILFAILYTLAYYLLTQTPLGSATDAEIIAYYADGNQRTLTLAGMFIMPFAGIAFLYFMVFLRRLANQTGLPVSRILGNVQQGAGLIFIAVLFVATAALVAAPASLQFAGLETDPQLARQLPLFGTTTLLMFGMRMASMFTFTSSSIGRATGMIPNWFGYLSYLVGVALLLAFTFQTWFALLFAAWVLVLCIIVLIRRSRKHS
jgi:hypothetical protein